jgi:menaquinol-cytochrome c reductase iron-sulfur subunit
MTPPDGISRRSMLMKVGIFLNGIVAAILAVPIIRYAMSSVTREKKGAYDSWLSLGSLEQFPAGETRLATFRSPDGVPWDGKTDDIPCWVRRIDAATFQVFAINCAHLNCPVRWFPQSRLFMCPCHGGAYYEDGSRASGPPERGLFQYQYRIEGGNLFIEATSMPTVGSASAKLVTIGKHPCA